GGEGLLLPREHRRPASRRRRAARFRAGARRDLTDSDGAPRAGRLALRPGALVARREVRRDFAVDLRGGRPGRTHARVIGAESLTELRRGTTREALRVVAAALHRELTLEVEDLDLLRLPVLLHELVTAQDGGEHAEVGPAGEVALLAYLRRREHGIAREARRG